MTATAPATAADAIAIRLGDLFNKADRAYLAWERASAERKREAWRRYVEANTAYWRAFFAKDTR